VLFLATRRVVNRTLVGVLVFGNLLWVVDSVLIAEGSSFLRSPRSARSW
jgi:hypothetical protein